MKQILLTIALITFSLLNVACSNQWAETNLDISSDEVITAFEEMSGQGGFSTQSVSTRDLLEDPAYSIYYAKSGSDLMGDVFSVFSFSDIGFLGFQENLSIVDIDPLETTVIFLDAYDSHGNRYYVLSTKMVHQDSTVQYENFVSEANSAIYTDDKFEVQLTGRSGTIVVSSYHLHDNFSEELASSIQLKVEEVRGGIRVPVGKFSHLMGFGGL